jgi:hypothetical protein
MTYARNAVGLILLLSLLTSACSQRETFIDDGAGLLSKRQRSRLEEFQQLLLNEQDTHLLIVTLKDPASDIDATAVELFDRHCLGEATAAARGLLLLIDPHNKQVRIEVGYDLEGILPDVTIAAIEHEQMLPFFLRQRVAAGIEALTELIVAKLMRSEDPQEPLPTQELEHYSGGAGARIDIVQEERQAVYSAKEIDFYSAQPTPMETLECYLQSLQMRIKSPELGLYTEETKEFLRNWLITDAQQKNALRDLNAVLAEAQVLELGDYAVIRFPQTQRKAAPHFLRRSTNGWQLDFATMSKTIRFNHRNQWHFVSMDFPYAEAFTDWSFDANGFPITR